jgi:hypothetical protein
MPLSAGEADMAETGGEEIILDPTKSDALQAGCKQAPSAAASSGLAGCLLSFVHFGPTMTPVE